MTNPATILAGLRVVVGASSLFAPALAAKPLGLSVEDNPQGAYLARLFGARDIALGAGTLLAPPEHRRTWLAAGLACDAADTVSAALEGRAQRIPRTTAIFGGAIAAGAVAIGALALKG